MAADDLTRPLGLAGRKAPARRLRVLGFAAGGLMLVAAVGALWFVLVRDPQSEGQSVVAAIDGDTTPPAEISSDQTGAIAEDPVVITEAPEDEIGLTEITPDGGLSEVGGDTIVIGEPDDPDAIRLAAAPIEDLAEDGDHGLLPRIGPDGQRPMDAYARPLGPEAANRRMRIAIVVGGIGIAKDSSDAAIENLPGAVTLAFAPYGKDLSQILARARASGHEILLQVPLEPYGYPSNDPGPHTLTVDASPEENIDRLHWLMSRITTYVGVMNYLGARFTSEEAALEPVIAEIGKRGLLYLDDGSSGMSRADRLAKDRTPFVRSDVVLDAITEATAIDQRLAEAEAIARERGFAIATATAFPLTIERIAAFAKKAAERDIEIVPVSALVATGRT